ESVDIGKTEVEDHGRGDGIAQRGPRPRGAGDGDHLVAGLRERGLDERPRARIVLDEEDPSVLARAPGVRHLVPAVATPLRYTRSFRIAAEPRPGAPPRTVLAITGSRKSVASV